MSRASMTKWLRGYEEERFREGGRWGEEHIGWKSSKFDWDSKDWENIRNVIIPELDGMTVYQAIASLRKSWKHLKSLRGGYDADLAYRINRYQFHLGIDLTPFDNSPYPIEFIRQQLALEEESGEQTSAEEIELKFEEEQARREDLVDMGLAEETEEQIEDEDPEYAILRREEKIAEAEARGELVETEQEEKDVWDDW